MLARLSMMAIRPRWSMPIMNTLTGINRDMLRAACGRCRSWLWIAYAIVLVWGAVTILGKTYFDESNALEAMKTCDMTVNMRSDGQPIPEDKIDALADSFPFIHIRAQRDAICDVFSKCDTDPQTGLKLFRKGLDADGSKNSHVIALTCAVYLARAQQRPVTDSKAGVLEKQDAERILAHLDPAKEPDADVRKVALRTLSDLTVLTDDKGVDRYSKLPEGTTGSVKTHADTFNGKPVLLIRWSSPETALAWWKQFAAGKDLWDMAQQRFVVP